LGDDDARTFIIMFAKNARKFVWTFCVSNRSCQAACGESDRRGRARTHHWNADRSAWESHRGRKITGDFTPNLAEQDLRIQRAWNNCDSTRRMAWRVK